MNEKTPNLFKLTEVFGLYPRKPVLFQTGHAILYPHNPASVVYDPIQGGYVINPDTFGNAQSQGEFVNNGLQMGTTGYQIIQQPLSLASQQTQNPCSPSNPSSSNPLPPAGVSTPGVGAGSRDLGNCPSGGCPACSASPGNSVIPTIPKTNPCPSGQAVYSCPSAGCSSACPSGVSNPGRGVQGVISAVQGWLTGRPSCPSAGCPACSAGSFNCPSASPCVVCNK